jgi:hypothetical protein
MPDIKHSGLYSLWLYVDRDNGARLTFVEVTETSTYGAPDGHVGVKWYSLNGCTDNREYVHREIPEEIRRLTIVKFWQLVDERKLIFLKEHPGEHFAPESILQVGDKV